MKDLRSWNGCFLFSSFSFSLALCHHLFTFLSTLYFPLHFLVRCPFLLRCNVRSGARTRERLNKWWRESMKEKTLSWRWIIIKVEIQWKSVEREWSMSRVLILILSLIGSLFFSEFLSLSLRFSLSFARNSFFSSVFLTLCLTFFSTWFISTCRDESKERTHFFLILLFFHLFLSSIPFQEQSSSFPCVKRRALLDRNWELPLEVRGEWGIAWIERGRHRKKGKRGEIRRAEREEMKWERQEMKGQLNLDIHLWESRREENQKKGSPFCLPGLEETWTIWRRRERDTQEDEMGRISSSFSSYGGKRWREK